MNNLKLEIVKNYNKVKLALLANLKSTIDLTKYENYKFSCANERLPQKGAIYQRAVAILLKSVHCPQSVKNLKKQFSKMKNRGVAPDRKYDASGYIIRHLVQDLQKYEYLNQHTKGRYAGYKTLQIIKQELK